MEKPTKNMKRIEIGQRMKFNLVLKAKVDNIYDSEEIEKVKTQNILICVKKMVKEFETMTGSKPNSASLSSDEFYLLRKAIEAENGEYQSSDRTTYEGIKIKGGCNLERGEVIISSWNTGKTIYKNNENLIIGS